VKAMGDRLARAGFACLRAVRALDREAQGELFAKLKVLLTKTPSAPDTGPEPSRGQRG
jgi:hypothetical protein